MSRSPAGQKPDSPTDLEGHNWVSVLKRTAAEFKDDNLTDWAAALTYYATLSLFPALIVFISLLGLLGQYPQTFNALLEIVRDLGPESAVDTFAGPLEAVIKEKDAAGALLGFGLAGALWSASGYIGAFIRASNAVYEIEEGRPFWKLRPLQLAVTVVGTLGAAAIAIALVVSGPLAKSIGRAVGLGETTLTLYMIVKWPILVALVMLGIAALYYVAPNVRQPKFRWITVGGVVAVLVWILASVGFAFYVTNFGSYNKTYGSFGGVIIFLLWLWLTNLALLFGVELDAELERERELKAGLPAHDEIQLPPRHAPDNG